MESYVVRIYRRQKAQPEKVVGLVEHPEDGSTERFSGMSELVNILLTPAQLAKTVAAPEEEIGSRGTVAKARTGTGD